MKDAAFIAGGLALARGVEKAFGSTLPGSEPQQPSAPNWAGKIGLELWTVRDLIAKDHVDTLEKVARIGYKEIEPATGYGNMTPKQYRALLDRLGLKAPSTHSGVTVGTDAEMEKQLAGFPVMGMEYSSLAELRPAGRPVATGTVVAGNTADRAMRGAARAQPTTPTAQRQATQQFIRNMVQTRAAENVKHEAARYNRIGELARKFGIKLLIHNHTAEFMPCKDSPDVPYTILLNETDPELVVFQLDIG